LSALNSFGKCDGIAGLRIAVASSASTMALTRTTTEPNRPAIRKYAPGLGRKYFKDKSCANRSKTRWSMGDRFGGECGDRKRSVAAFMNQIRAGITHPADSEAHFVPSNGTTGHKLAVQAAINLWFCARSMAPLTSSSKMARKKMLLR